MRSGSNLTSIPTNRSYNPDVMDAVYTILNELRGSVASLQTANEGLQKELQLVKRELKVLQQGSGARFPKFGQLPPEVRRSVTYWFVAFMAVANKFTGQSGNMLAELLKFIL